MLVPGFLDSDRQPASVVGYPTKIYLGDGTRFIEFRADGYSGQLVFGNVADVDLPEEMLDELSPMFVDLGWMVLGEPIPRRLESISLYLDDASDLLRNRARAAVVLFAGGRVLVLDALSTLGIDIGGAESVRDLDREILQDGRGSRVVVHCPARTRDDRDLRRR
ncbi:hypothetical protein [Antribacter gilvus]|uniref:hypothetical protein n=1 Tax=Antribacter gilvus TaxID=2304675 RepID=UPI000F7B1AEB|nr:hypothetical protein [Antribacter gilvus]